MTLQEFIDKNRHEIGGLCLDMMQKAEGPSLSLVIRTVMRKIDNLLKNAYEDLIPPPPPPPPKAPKPAEAPNGKERPHERHEGKAATPATGR